MVVVCQRLWNKIASYCEMFKVLLMSSVVTLSDISFCVQVFNWPDIINLLLFVCVKETCM